MKSEIKALCGIRGVAALWVALYHYHVFNSILAPLDIPSNSFISTVLMKGYLSVDLFFILSGFVLAMAYHEQYQTGWTLKKYGTFLHHRFARLYPLYAMVTLASAVMIWFGFGDTRLQPHIGTTLLANLAVIQQWGVAKSILGQAWTISVDLAAYLAFPVLTWALMKTRRRIEWLVILAAVAGLYWLQHMTADMHKRGALDIVYYRSWYPILRGIIEFSIGLATYRVLASGHAALALIKSKYSGYALLIAMFILMPVKQSDFAIVACIPFFLLHLTLANDGITKPLSHPVMLTLGRASYAIYLLHAALFPVRSAMDNGLEPAIGDDGATLLSTSLVMMVLVIGGIFVYRYIERPAQKLLR